MVADFYEVDERTIERYITQNEEELSHNGCIVYIPTKTMHVRPQPVTVPIVEKAQTIIDRFADLPEAIVPRVNECYYNRMIHRVLTICVLADATDTDTAPLLSFFHDDLADDWQSILEAVKVLSELTLNGRSSALDYESKSTQAQFRALCAPFKAVLAQGLACSTDSASEYIGK